MKVRHLALAGMLALSACASPPAPQPSVDSGPLRGSITAGVYRDMRDWFSVAIPFQHDGELQPYIHVDEETPDNISYVNFISLDKPGEYYRVYAEDFFARDHLVPDLDEVADSILRVYGRRVVAARGTTLELQQEKDWKLGDTLGIMRFYTQKIPTELLSLDLMQGPGLGEDYTAYILMYVTARNGKVAMLWAEWPEDCSVCVPIPAGRAPAGDADALTKALAQDARAEAFFNSFSYSAGASAH